MFSYASPEALQAAKLESLEGKIQAHLKTKKSVSLDLLGEHCTLASLTDRPLNITRPLGRHTVQCSTRPAVGSCCSAAGPRCPYKV